MQDLNIENPPDKDKSVTTNDVLIFMTFLLILSGCIVNAISINTILPKMLCVGGGGGVGINSDVALSILKEIRIKNIKRGIIGTLNINSLHPKFEQLKLIIGNCLDVLVTQETKHGPSFTTEQFMVWVCETLQTR